MRWLMDSTAPDPRPAGNGTNLHGGATDSSFDTNMVIILAALLCALICALGINSVVRCVLRCCRRIALEETSEEAAARLAATGLKKRALRRIPVAVYGGPEAKESLASATECTICLGEFADGEKIRVLPRCNHGFHVQCIDTWLAAHSSCPTCRHSLLDRSGGGTSRAAQWASRAVAVGLVGGGIAADECIDTWLAAHSSCPMCRHSLLDRNGGGTSRAAQRGESCSSVGESCRSSWVGRRGN